MCEAALTQAMSQLEVGLFSYRNFDAQDCAVAQDRVEILIDPDTRPDYLAGQTKRNLISYH